MVKVTAAFLIANAQGDPPPVQWRHYSNHAVNSVLGEGQSAAYYQLFCSYEDSNIDNEPAALEDAQIVEAVCPGAYVWIRTGDYIFGSAGWRFHTYDPHYRLLAVPIIDWQGKQDELDRVEREWRWRKTTQVRGMRYYEAA